MDYVGQLREGILEAYTGIVTGLKKTEKSKRHLLSVRQWFILTYYLSVTLILPHSQSILDLVRRCLADDERSDTLMRLSYGLIGDLADSFPAGQLKQLLLQTWIASELRSRHRMPDETKKTMRWAREVRIPLLGT